MLSKNNTSVFKKDPIYNYSNSGIDLAILIVLTKFIQKAYLANKEWISTVREELIQEIHLGKPIDQVFFLQSDTSSSCTGVVVVIEDSIFVAIRGTESFSELFYTLVSVTNKNGQHSGIKVFAQSVFEPLAKVLNNLPLQTSKLYLSGHSLGGAACLDLMSQIENAFSPPNMTVYTFGAPPFSAKPLQFNHPYYRCRAAGDCIPYLPQLFSYLTKRFQFSNNWLLNNIVGNYGSSCADFKHWESSEYIINRNGILEVEGLGMTELAKIGQGLLSSLNQAQDSTKDGSVFEKFGMYCFKEHSIAHYHDLLQSQCIKTLIPGYFY